MWGGGNVQEANVLREVRASQARCSAPCTVNSATLGRHSGWNENCNRVGSQASRARDVQQQPCIPMWGGGNVQEAYVLREVRASSWIKEQTGQSNPESTRREDCVGFNTLISKILIAAGYHLERCRLVGSTSAYHSTSVE